MVQTSNPNPIDDACAHQVSLKYLERIKCFGPNKSKLMDEWTDGDYISIHLSMGV